jgi:hypothetical protein
MGVLLNLYQQLQVQRESRSLDLKISLLSVLPPPYGGGMRGPPKWGQACPFGPRPEGTSPSGLANNFLRYYFQSPCKYIEDNLLHFVGFSVAPQKWVSMGDTYKIPDFVVSKLIDNDVNNDWIQALFMEVKRPKSNLYDLLLQISTSIYLEPVQTYFSVFVIILVGTKIGFYVYRESAENAAAFNAVTGNEKTDFVAMDSICMDRLTPLVLPGLDTSGAEAIVINSIHRGHLWSLEGDMEIIHMYMTYIVQQICSIPYYENGIIHYSF